MNTPGLNHIILTVSDLDRSRAFYGDLLGFEIHTYENMIFFVVGDVQIWFVHHDNTPADDCFNEFRIGLDHLSFAAPDEASMHELVAKLRLAGVETTDVKTFPTGNKYVVFRDPDNIQLEYWMH